jgi:hypothetical protein
MWPQVWKGLRTPAPGVLERLKITRSGESVQNPTEITETMYACPFKATSCVGRISMKINSRVLEHTTREHNVSSDQILFSSREYQRGEALGDARRTEEGLGLFTD